MQLEALESGNEIEQKKMMLHWYGAAKEMAQKGPFSPLRSMGNGGAQFGS